MKQILRLLRLQIDNKTDMLKAATPRTMIPAIAKTVVTLVLAIVALSFALGRIFILGFRINEELISLLLAVTQVVALAFAIGTVINTLYLCRDNEMLICLPVMPNQLFISKLLLVYIIELAVNAAMFIPLFVSLGLVAYNGLGISYYLSIPIMVLLMPLLPLVFAAFISIPLMWVINFFKKHNVLSIIAIFGLVAICLWGYISAIGSLAGEFDITNDKFATVEKINTMIASVGSQIPVYFQLAKAMLDFSSNWYIFPIFVVGIGVLIVLTYLVTRFFFFKIAMSTLEKNVNKKERIKTFRKVGSFASLLQKEFFCVFRSSADVFEYFLFTLLMPFIVYSYDKLLMSITVNQAGINMIAGAHVMVVAILAMLSNISSASAISRDGGNFYTSKIVPVSYYKQLFAKFSFNAIFTLGAIIVTAIVSVFIYPAWQVLLGSLAVAMAAIGHIAYCIDTDIKDPTPNLVGNESSSTVSKTTPKALISGLIIGFILGIIVILMSGVENLVIPYLIINAISLVFMIYRVYTLVLRINLAYDKIEM